MQTIESRVTEIASSDMKWVRQQRHSLTGYPEGNRIELFVQTPWYMPPVSVPLDLHLSDEEIYRETEAMVEGTPGHMKRTEWHERARAQMREEGTIEQRVLASALHGTEGRQGRP